MAGLCLAMPLGLMEARDDGRSPRFAEIAQVFRAGARVLRRLVPVVAAWVADRLRPPPRRQIRVPRLPVLRLPRLSPAPAAALPRPGPGRLPAKTCGP